MTELIQIKAYLDRTSQANKRSSSSRSSVGKWPVFISCSGCFHISGKSFKYVKYVVSHLEEATRHSEDLEN